MCTQRITETKEEKEERERERERERGREDAGNKKEILFFKTPS